MGLNQRGYGVDSQSLIIWKRLILAHLCYYIVSLRRLEKHFVAIYLLNNIHIEWMSRVVKTKMELCINLSL